MSRLMTALGGLTGALLLASASTTVAADLSVQTRVERAGSECGPCGCLQVTYVQHPELWSTYGLDFDPRNYDTTEPHYYLGPIRAYPRFFVNGWPVSPSC